MVYEIDLNTGEPNFLDFHFPKDYMPEGVKHFEGSITHGANKHVYSLFGDHRLFYVDEFGDSLKLKNGNSEFLPEKFPYFPPNADGFTYRKYS